VPTGRRDRASATLTLVALMLGAIVAGTATVAAQPRMIAGFAAAGLAGAAAASTETPVAGAQAAAGAQVAGGTPAATVEPALVEPAQPTEPPAVTTPPSGTPATSTQPSPVPATTAAVTSQVQRVVELVNIERRKAGCPALAVDQRLAAAAQAHSTDMAVNHYFSHVSLDGRTFADRILAAGYPRPAAENIAMGQPSAEEVMRAWMRSRGHRANILDCGLVAIGVGLDTRGWYWTQDFGR